MRYCSNPRCQKASTNIESDRCSICQAFLIGIMVRGRFQIVRLVGKGGFGTTYLVRDHDCFAEERILKELSPHPFSETDEDEHSKITAERLFQREAKMLLSLQNPGIPKLHAYFTSNSYSYLVQDWIPGKTLSEELKLRSETFTEAEVCNVLMELADILTYLHGHNPPIIHRDIKPQNLMRHSSGKLLLIDFGAVYQAAGARGSKTLIGSPGYAPAEQILGEPVPQSDLYATGATAVYLLTGIHPTKLYNNVSKRIEWENQLQASIGLAELITDLLATDIDKRLYSAIELRQRLEKILTTHPQTRPIFLQSNDSTITPLLHQSTELRSREISPTELKSGDLSPIDSNLHTQKINVEGTIEHSESQSFHTADDPPEEVGDLLLNPYPFLLRRIYRERMSGRLTCINQGINKTIYFEEGTIVYAKSNLKSDRLGERMIEIGRISAKDFDTATNLMQSQNLRFGSALINMGRIQPEELKPMITEQFANITYSLFNWESGSYEICHKAPRKRSIRISISTANIIFEGLRRLQNLDLVKHWLGDFNWKLSVTTDPFLLYQTVTLNPREAFIASRIENSMSVNEILSLGGLPENEILKTICGLLAVGILDWVKSDSDTRPTSQPIANVISEKDNAPDDLQFAAAFCYEVENILSTIDTINHYALLGVARNATEDEIRASYTRMAKKFHPDRHAQLAKYNLSLRGDLEKIFKRISQVYYVLSDTNERLLYDRNFRSSGAIKLDSINKDLLRAKYQPAVPTSPPAPTSAPVASSTPPAAPTLPPNTVSSFRIALKPAMVGQQLPNDRPASGSYATPRSTTNPLAINQGPSTAANALLIEAQNEFQKGVEHYRELQLKKAHLSFQSAVDLCPTNAEFHIFLARTLAQMPGYYNKAREVFNKALELAPENADYYAEVGLFYQKLGMFKIAAHMFEKSLELVPGHPIARRAKISLVQQ